MASLSTIAVGQPAAVRGLAGSSIHGNRLVVKPCRRTFSNTSLRSRRVSVVAKYGEKSIYFDLEDLGNTTGQWDLYGSDAPSPYNPLQDKSKVKLARRSLGFDSQALRQKHNHIDLVSAREYTMSSISVDATFIRFFGGKKNSTASQI